MKKRIVVYEKDRRMLASLKSFFQKRRGYQVEYVDSPASLNKALVHDDDPDICFISADELGWRTTIPSRTSVIATIPGGSSAAIQTAIKKGVDNYLLSPFSQEDLAFKIKSVLDKRQLVSRLEKERTDLRLVTELTYLVSSTLDPQEILYLVVKKISEVIPITRCSIIRADGVNRYAHVVSTFEDPKLKNIRLDLSKYPEIKRALVRKEPVVISDVTTDPLMERVRDILFPLGICSIVVIPIIFHEEVIGTLFLRTSRTRSAFTEYEINLCHVIANVSANALYNAFLFEKMEDEKARLEKLAITDFLTGVYNIRYFYHRLTEEFSRSVRYNLPLTCLMIDIDHFKDINDKYGHRTGDIVLRDFAHFLKKQTRKSDVLARYGGEEFIMLLAQTTESGGAAKAEAMRAFVAGFQFRALKGAKGPTISIGIASYPSPLIKDKEDLITFADDALYKAKTTGRNQVVVY
ncbi:MAG: diguanylate cyclase [Thermodesulfovibrionales bacterium]|jgi:two-component system cell cycle response regulator